MQINILSECPTNQDQHVIDYTLINSPDFDCVFIYSVFEESCTQNIALIF